jgi:FkbM family methyltransferase
MKATAPLYYLRSALTLLQGVRNRWTMARLFLGPRPPEPVTVVLDDGTRFRVREAMDLWIVKESCLDRQYEAGLTVGDGWTVVDVGAGLGDFAIHFARRHPQAQVYACEPFPESLALLRSNLILNHVANVRAYPYALGGRTGTAHLSAVGPAVQHSTVRDGDSPDLVVPLRTLDDLFEELGIEGCDLLKVDTEGAEYEILFNAGEETLDKVARVVLEYHEGVTPYGRGDLVAFLEGRDFTTRVEPNPVHPSLGLLYAWRE